MLQLALRYGLIAGVAIAIAFYLPYFVFGLSLEWLQFSEILGYTWMVLSMSAVIFAMRRERATRGGLSYSRGLGVGSAVAGVAAVVFGLATWAMFAATADELVPVMMDYYANHIRSSGAPPAEIERQLAEMDRMRPLMSNGALQGAIMAATVFVIGVLLSLIAAAFLRRRPA